MCLKKDGKSEVLELLHLHWISSSLVKTHLNILSVRTVGKTKTHEKFYFQVSKEEMKFGKQLLVPWIFHSGG